MNRVSRKYLLLAALLSASCNPARGCSTGTSELWIDSRLPGWFSVPAGRSRDDVSVTLSYYSVSALRNDVVTYLVDQQGYSLASATGEQCWHPVMHDKINAFGGFDVDVDPLYVIVTVRGITEVIEHTRQSRFFRVVDNPRLVAQAKESTSKGECRKEP